MKHFLVVVDMQRDFVNGSLGTAEADAMIPQAVEKIRSFDGDIFVTYDTHFADYLESAEGKKLPVPHCILDTLGMGTGQQDYQMRTQRPQRMHLEGSLVMQGEETSRRSRL